MEIFGEYGTINQADVLPFEQWASSDSIQGYVVSDIYCIWYARVDNWVRDFRTTSERRMQRRLSSTTTEAR